MYLATLKIFIYYIEYLKQIHLLMLGMQPVIMVQGWLKSISASSIYHH